MNPSATLHNDCEYIVVGSGAGGGTLAARLAESGHKVILIEAGGDPRELSGGDPISKDNRLPDDYDVPVFHALCCENEAMKWDFFVRHYADDAVQKLDSKFTEDKDGVLYPRAGTLGGCTAHNAMIMVYPHNADWDGIAEATGDESWRSDHMRSYFEKLENCHHRPLLRDVNALAGANPARHGWDGWLHTEKAIPESALGDNKLVDVIKESAFSALEEVGHTIERARWLIEGDLDPNDWRLVSDDSIGLRYPPLATCNHQRVGTRERLLDVAKRFPDRLHIEMNALATRVLFDHSNRAIGIEYLKGARLYRASGHPSGEAGEKREIHASREVILSGGAFNTPQLLMLSGIGPKDELEAHGIAVRVDLPGVGKNLQDRYEVGVVNRMNFPYWEVLKDAKFAKGDPQYAQWANHRKGVYTTNGAVLAVIKRSAPERALPDLFCFALLGYFKGYYPDFSAAFQSNLNVLTWAILKAHTNNTAGEVTLRSADPLDTPFINFRYFGEGNDMSGEDLESVVDGIKFVRAMTRDLRERDLMKEEVPGDAVASDEELRAFVRDNAWGHHASCTCAIGSVLGSDFTVHGTKGLRVVDASVFPRIPGFFIVSAVYMIGEKAADVIMADARKTG